MKSWHTLHFVDQEVGPSVAELIANWANLHRFRPEDYKVIPVTSRGVIALLVYGHKFKVTCLNCN